MLRSKLLPAACALALTLPACVENDQSLFVAGVLAAEVPECEYRADQGSARLPSGRMDVGFTTNYKAELLVGLQMAPRGNKSKLRAESMNFQVRGAEVRLTDSTGDLVDEFSVPAGGQVSPVTAETPGFGLSEVVLVPHNVGRELREELASGGVRTLVAEVRLFGDTLGGVDLTSGSFSFVIEVCNGCLARAIADGWSYNDTSNRWECDASITEPLIENGCHYGQDGVFDCRACQTSACAIRSF